MKILLDTHLLLWVAENSSRLSTKARDFINNPQHTLYFSAASIWEIAIKQALGRADFQVNTRLLYRGLLDNGYLELAITARHAVEIDRLPTIHKDPFDRILITQASIEGFTLLTSDTLVCQYSKTIQKV